MDLSSLLLENSDVVNAIAGQLGIDGNQAQQAISALAPALAGGIKKNINMNGGADALAQLLNNNKYEDCIDQPQQFLEQRSIEEGNSLLGEFFGSKNISRAVAGQAAADTGLDVSMLKMALPLLAKFAMGNLSKKFGGANNQADSNALSGLFGKQDSSNGMFKLVTSFLDADGDGLDIGDIAGLAKKFFK